MNHHRSFGWSVAIGSFFIIVGILGALNNLDYIDIGGIWNLWPVIFLIVGVSKMVNAERPTDRPDGLFWIFLGAYFFVANFRLLGLHYGDAWPLILVGVGGSMVWKSVLLSSRSTEAKEVFHATPQ